MIRGKILDTAKKIINGDRQDAYGNPEDCFELIKQYWSTYLKIKLTPAQVAMMMVFLKLAREGNNHKTDNQVDACGYLALYEDLIGGQK